MEVKTASGEGKIFQIFTQKGIVELFQNRERSERIFLCFYLKNVTIEVNIASRASKVFQILTQKDIVESFENCKRSKRQFSSF